MPDRQPARLNVGNPEHYSEASVVQPAYNVDLQFQYVTVDPYHQQLDYSVPPPTSTMDLSASFAADYSQQVSPLFFLGKMTVHLLALLFIASVCNCGVYCDLFQILFPHPGVSSAANVDSPRTTAVCVATRYSS